MLFVCYFEDGRLYFGGAFQLSPGDVGGGVGVHRKVIKVGEFINCLRYIIYEKSSPFCTLQVLLFCNKRLLCVLTRN